MKYLVNGVERDLNRGNTPTIEFGSDRLYVATPTGKHSGLVVKSGGKTHVSYKGRTYLVEKAVRHRQGESHSGELRSPMPGQIVEVLVAPGQQVAEGQRLLVLEAMKMQLPVVAPASGKVGSVSVAKGDQVGEGQVLAVMEAPE